MILSKSNVVHYLVAQGLLSLESVVDGDLIVADATARNRNFKIIRRLERGYFVKQIRIWNPPSIALLGAEAVCYKLARGAPELPVLADLVPSDCLHDTQRHVLVTELLPDGESLADCHRRNHNFPPALTQRIGTQFGSLHRDPASTLEGRPEAAVFGRQPPWILSAHRQGTNMFGALTGANEQLLRVVQSYPDYQYALDELRADWRVERLIHGDVTWDNCVAYRASGTGALAIKVVDWEIADIGDPAWDIGAFLQGYISFWILSMRMSGDVPPARFVETALYPIEAMQPSIRAFWNAYIEAMEMEHAAAQALLIRCIRYGAARMIQTSYEVTQYAPQMTLNALCLLQVSFNILKEPQEAVTHLLGL